MNMKTGRNRRLLISKNSILMLVMLVVVFLAVSAWFYAKLNDANATGITVKTSSQGALQLALPYNGSYPDFAENEEHDPNAGFFDKINFSETDYMRDMLKDVTGDGKKFIIPTFDSAISVKDGRTVVENGEWVDADSSKTVLDDEFNENDNKYYYISLDFYARAKSPTVGIREGSYLSTLSEIEKKPLKSQNKDDIINPSSVSGENGFFSADAIVGAMRVSLVGAPVSGHSESNGVWNDTYQGDGDWDATSKCKFLWLPRPDLFLQTDDSMTRWNLKTGVKPTDMDGVTYKHSFYKAELTSDEVTNRGKKVTKTIYNDKAIIDKDADDEEPDFFHVTKIDNKTNTHVDSSKSLYDTPKFGQNVTIEDEKDSNTLVRFKNNEEYYLYKFKLNLWIEGDDAEARRAMNDGQFKLNLVFG